jgi:adenylate cyclase
VATRVLEILESVGHPVPAGAATPTVAFVDLSGFTRFAEATGDAAAAERAAQLEALAQEAAVQRGGRLVKSLGDGAMLLFDEAGAGVVACLDIVAAVARLADVEARAGLATGPVVQRDGDVFGATVNLAARIADHARPGEVLVSRLTREAAGPGPLAFAGPREASLKGIAAPVALYAAAAG